MKDISSHLSSHCCSLVRVALAVRPFTIVALVIIRQASLIYFISLH